MSVPISTSMFQGESKTKENKKNLDSRKDKLTFLKSRIVKRSAETELQSFAFHFHGIYTIPYCTNSHSRAMSVQ